MTTPLPPTSERDASTAAPARRPGRLYKMSTTAGVGAYDYVAVNTPAVVAILAGLASISVLMSSVMFIVPLFAILAAIVAIVQIRKSNGTQTGIPLAIGGIVLALLCSAWVAFGEYKESRQLNQYRSEITATFDKFTKATNDGDFQAAYNLFSPAFRSAISFDRFTSELKGIEGAGAGRISGYDWNQRLEAMSDPQAGRDLARASLRLRFTNDKAGSVEVNPVLSHKAGEEWLIEKLDPLFAQQAPPSRGTGTGAGGPGGE